jgi:hypothetical protein
MEIVFLWFMFAVVAGVAASSRGRSGFGWFVLSVLLSPLIGILLVLVLPNLRTQQQAAQLAAAAAAASARPAEPVITEATHRKCPACAEWVLRDAFKCKHCGHDLITEDVKRSLSNDTHTDGLDELEVVGESNYQDALRPIAEIHASFNTPRLLTATLRPEPTNAHDKNAVRVELAGRLVGYLPREIAKRYAGAVCAHFNVSSGTPELTAPAEVRGKDRNYGVWVYLPEELVDRLVA